LAGPYMRDKTTAKSLEDLIKISENCLCTDRRDKIYGLLGLTSDGSERDVVVDYSQSIFDLYEAVVMFQRKMFACHGSSREKVIGFSQLLQKTLLVPFDSTHLQMGKEFEKRTRTLVFADLKHFQIHGLILGEILSEASLIKETQKTENSLATMATQVDTLGISSRETLLPIPGEPSAPTWQLNIQDIWAKNSFTFVNFEALRTARTEAVDSRVPDGLDEPGKSPSWSHGLDIFYTKDWGVGIAPKGVRNGDLLCRFQTDIVESRSIHAIIRPHTSGKFCVGRAILVNEFLKNSCQGWLPAETLDRSLPRFYLQRGGKTSRATVTLGIDICILQALTCPLSLSVPAAE
jgi:hypothetical protein